MTAVVYSFLINLFGTMQCNISVNFRVAEALYCNSASSYFVPLFVYKSTLIYVCALYHQRAILLKWTGNVTATHTVNNLLEYNLYPCYSYNWICLLGLFFFFLFTSWRNWLRRTTSFTSQPRKHTKLTSELTTPILWSRSMMSITWIFPKSAFHLVLKFLHLSTSVSFYCSVWKLNFCFINVKYNLLNFCATSNSDYFLLLLITQMHHSATIVYQTKCKIANISMAKIAYKQHSCFGARTCCMYFSCCGVADTGMHTCIRVLEHCSPPCKITLIERYVLKFNNWRILK